MLNEETKQLLIRRKAAHDRAMAELAAVEARKQAIQKAAPEILKRAITPTIAAFNKDCEANELGFGIAFQEEHAEGPEALRFSMTFNDYMRGISKRFDIVVMESKNNGSAMITDRLKGGRDTMTISWSELTEREFVSVINSLTKNTFPDR